MIGLERVQPDACGRRAFCQRIVDVGQCGMSIGLRLARTEQIEVRTMQNQHFAVAGGAADGRGVRHGGSTSSTKLRGDYRSLEGFV